MKLLLKLTFIITLFSFTQSYGQELIVNGGFETGSTDPFYGSGISASTTEPYTGNYRLNLKNDWCHISQDITTVIGTEYAVSFYYRQAFEGADATDFSSMWMKDDNGVRVGTLNELDMPMVYTNFTYTFTATSTTSTFYIQHPTRANGGSNNAVWVDDISIVEEGYVPPPPELIDPLTPVGQQPEGSVSGDWEIDFSDEFNGDASVIPNPDRWLESLSTSPRDPRPFQGIDEWYFKPDHVSVNGVGQLELRASKISNDPGIMHTGGVLTNNLYEPQYGYFEARIEIASTLKGNHTAFWLQGDNMGNVDGTGNDGAEVDIFESAWVGDFTKAVVHIDGYGANHQANTRQYNTPNLHSGYHTFGIYWDADKMEIYYDGVKKTTYLGIWVPQVPEFLLVSVGASFGDGEFHLQPIGDLSIAKVDWVRAYKPAGSSAVNGHFIEDAFDIYPNPANDFVNIKSQENSYSVVIYNINGRMLYNSQNSKSTKVDVSAYESGLYFFKITSNKASKTYKVLVK